METDLAAPLVETIRVLVQVRPGPHLTRDPLLSLAVTNHARTRQHQESGDVISRLDAKRSEITPALRACNVLELQELALPHRQVSESQRVRVEEAFC
eukprot:16428322-Heterocapsa_arctica.AAC.1